MLIGGFLIVVGIIIALDGQWGAATVMWAIALFLIGCWNAEKLDTKAWYNRTKYWADRDE